MFLSVIIPTRNRASHLEAALHSLQRQTYGVESFEVLVVDNGSTDHTRQVCETCCAFLPNLNYIYEGHPGLHEGRHRGLERARADILVFADDDIEAFPTWLEGIAEAFRDEKVVLVGGRNLPKFQIEPPGWIQHLWERDRNGVRMLPYLSILDLGNAVKAVSPYFVFGCNFSIRKSVLIEAGGFHPDAMPKELIRYRGDGETHVARYIAKRGYGVVYHPKASVHHLISADRLNESYFFKRAFRQGISDSYAEIRSKKSSSHSKLCVFKVALRLLRALTAIRRVGIQIGYLQGYCYHQDEVRSDPGLYDWVMRDTYFR